MLDKAIVDVFFDSEIKDVIEKGVPVKEVGRNKVIDSESIQRYLLDEDKLNIDMIRFPYPISNWDLKSKRCYAMHKLQKSLTEWLYDDSKLKREQKSLLREKLEDTRVLVIVGNRAFISLWGDAKDEDELVVPLNYKDIPLASYYRDHYKYVNTNTNTTGTPYNYYDNYNVNLTHS